jgi:hypothetical protein
MSHPGWDRPEPGDQIQFGAARRRPWLIRLAVAAVVIVAIVVLAVQATSGGHARPAARPSIATANIGHPILGETTGWDLFVRGASFVADIQPGSGRVTRTAVPPLTTGNPVASFIVGPHEVIVRSYDFVPGYVIPDGQPARQLTGMLATSGPLVPGPAPDEVWTQVGTSQDLHLVTVSGHQVGPVIRFPPNGPPQMPVIADGRGYLLDTTIYGRFIDLGPTWDQPVYGGVMAVGPTGWLTQQCARDHRCRDFVIHPATGWQQLVPGVVRPSRFRYWLWAPGVVAPDGTLAAVLDGQSTTSTRLRLELIDLDTGARLPVNVEFGGQPIPESMAWSPDCRWLFVAWQGKLLAVSAVSGKVTTLHLGLPPVSQIAVRTTAP